MDIPKLIAAQRAYFETGATHDIAVRRRALQALQASVRRHEEVLCSALRADLGKSAVESYMTEIGIVAGEIRFALRNLKRWMRPRCVPTPLFAWPARSRVRYEPLGVVLVVAPWNYPLQLTLLPLVGALAAGNCVVLKPSPGAPATAAVLSEIVGECFPEELVALVPHAPQAVEELLTQRFDHIFYTGGGTFGREIMVRAAERLTPVTLELGGKSPCVVGAEADLKLAARRIVWGKTLNAGQTCVAPDFLLVHESVCDRLLVELQRAVERQWGSDPRFAVDYPRMVDGAHARRVAELLSTAGGETVCGGEVLEEERYVAPTIVLNPDSQSRLMREEIFAPVLPVLTFAELSEAAAARRRPAAGTLLFRRRTRRPPSVRAGAVGRGGVQRCGDAGVESSPALRRGRCERNGTLSRRGVVRVLLQLPLLFSGVETLRPAAALCALSQAADRLAAAADGLVAAQHGVRYVAVRDELDRAAVVAQLLLVDDVRIVPVNMTVDADDALHHRGDRPHVVRHHDDGHAAVQLLENAV